MKKTIAALTAAACLVMAPAASATFGENYDLVPINGGPGSGTMDVPAIPDSERLLWAGVCDRGSAPAAGADLGALGGIGTMPSTATAPSNPGGDHAVIANVPLLGSVRDCIDWRLGLTNAISNLWEPPPNWRLPDIVQAGAHGDGTATFGFNNDGDTDNIYVDLPPGFVGNPGAVPKCTAEQFAIAVPVQCPPASQVGVITLRHLAAPGGGNFGGGVNTETYPIYNLEPRQGNAAELGIPYVTMDGRITVRLIGKARTNGDFGITTFIGQIPGSALPIYHQNVTLWGVPWAAHNDVWRMPQGLSPGSSVGCSAQPGTNTTNVIPPGGFSEACRQSYQPSWGAIQPFISLETDCNPAPVTRFFSDAYQFPGSFLADGSSMPGEVLTPRNGYPDPADSDWRIYDSPAPAVQGCEKLGFDPNITLDPTGQGGAAAQSADSPSGLDVELTIPQNNEPPFNAPPDGAPQEEVDQYVADAAAFFRSDNGLATAHLKDTVVTLPEGMTLNPAAADGQAACTMAQIGVTDTDSPTPPAIRFNNAPVGCPDASKVAEVVIETPLLEEADWPTGDAYLAAQGANPFGSDFAIYIAVTSPERGVIVKLAGKVVPDPRTGRLTTTFVQNPELPFDKFELRFKGGPRAPLATPVTCGTHTSVSSFASHAQPNDPVSVEDPFAITSSPAGGCPATPAQRPLNVGFAAGSTQLVAGAHSPFTVRLTRPDGNQELDRVEVTTPEGFAARLAGVAQCSEAAIAQAKGRTASGDGAREQASPSCPEAARIGTTAIGAGAGSQPFYVKGSVYLAGPYRGAPLSLAFIVPAVAGPFDLGVQVVRAAVHVNPKTAQITTVSDPIPQILRGVPLRLRDIRVDVDRPGFALNPTDCAEQLVTGRISGSHGAVSEVSNRFQVAECARLAFKPRTNIRLFGKTKRGAYQGVRAVVRPRPGDANIERAVVRFPRSAFVAQEHLKNICTRVQFAADACPKRSVYGRALAYSPLLDYPLTGNVYLRSSDNTLPDLVADLRGPAHQPIKIEVAVKNDSVKGALRNTVEAAPDTPVSYFRLQTFGRSKGLIVNSKNICRGKNQATVVMKGHNGRRSVRRVKVFNKRCKVQRRKAKAKRNGHSRRAAR